LRNVFVIKLIEILVNYALVILKLTILAQQYRNESITYAN